MSFSVYFLPPVTKSSTFSYIIHHIRLRLHFPRLLCFIFPNLDDSAVFNYESPVHWLLSRKQILMPLTPIASLINQQPSDVLRLRLFSFRFTPTKFVLNFPPCMFPSFFFLSILCIYLPMTTNLSKRPYQFPIVLKSSIR